MKLTTQELQALDSAHYIHPFTDTAALAKKGARIIVKGEGVYIWDSDGHKIFDAMSGLWCVNVGYGRKELADAAYAQMMQLPFYNSFFQTSTEPSIHLAKLLADVSPSQFNRVFFSGSGSEGNDTIVRLARHYWSCLGQPQKKTIIGRWNGYHGSTMAGASLGGMEGMHQQGGLPIPDIAHIQQPYWFEIGRTQFPELCKDEFGLKAASWLEEAILDIGADRVAAFIGEPVQGAGGVIIPPTTYWPEIQRICRKYDVLLVTDEVICGFGRLGEWLGVERYGVVPDIATTAKGLTSAYAPMGAVMVSGRVAEPLFDAGRTLLHGITFGGHPLSAAIGLRNLEIFEREQILERVRENEPHLRRRLAELRHLGVHTALDDFGTGYSTLTWLAELGALPIVGDVRGAGFFWALELVCDSADGRLDADTREALLRGYLPGRLLEAGLIARPDDRGDAVLHVAPPLVCGRDELDLLVDRVGEVLTDAGDELTRRGILA